MSASLMQFISDIKSHFTAFWLCGEVFFHDRQSALWWRVWKSKKVPDRKDPRPEQTGSWKLDRPIWLTRQSTKSYAKPKKADSVAEERKRGEKSSKPKGIHGSLSTLVVISWSTKSREWLIKRKVPMFRTTLGAHSLKLRFAWIIQLEFCPKIYAALVMWLRNQRSTSYSSQKSPRKQFPSFFSGKIFSQT